MNLLKSADFSTDTDRFDFHFTRGESKSSRSGLLIKTGTAGYAIRGKDEERGPIRQEHEYIRVIDRGHITTAIDQRNKVGPSQSIGGLPESDLEEIDFKLQEWEAELFRIVEVIPDTKGD